jgi:hypothetical protein
MKERITSSLPSSIVYLREGENHESENERGINRMQGIFQRTTFYQNNNNEDGIHDKI